MDNNMNNINGQNGQSGQAPYSQEQPLYGYNQSQYGKPPYGMPTGPGPYYRPEIKQSGLGIASLILAIFSDFVLFILVVLAVILAQQGAGEESVPMIIAGLMMLGFMFLLLVSIFLGIAGLCQSDRKKVFPVLGIVFSFFPLLILIGLMVLGSIVD